MSVVEVMVALALLTAVFGSVTALMSWTAAGMSTAVDRDGAQALANATLEEAKAHGCGLVTGAEASVDRWVHLCWGGLGDSAYTTTSGARLYSVVLHTAWRQVGAGPNACIDPHAPTNRPKTALAAADGLERQVTVSWTASGSRHEVAATDYESVPPDAVAYRDSSRGAVLLQGPAGSVAAVSARSGGPTVTRTVDPSGCALFPFLPAGSVTWSIGPQSGTATVVAEQIAVEPGHTVVA